MAIDVSYDLRTAVYDRLQRLDFATHDRMDTGQVVSRASSDVGMMLAILSIVPILLGNVVLLVVSLIVMTVLSPALTLIALLMVPLLLVTGLKMRNAVFPATWDAQQRAGEVAGVVDEAVTGVRVVKGFGQEERELRHLAGTAEGLYQSRTRLVRIQALYTPTLSSIPVLGQVAVLVFGGWLAMEGHISLGTFLAFSSYLIQMVSPVRMLATAMAITQQARAAPSGCSTSSTRPSNIVDAPDAVDARPGALGDPLRPTSTSTTTRAAATCSTGSTSPCAPARPWRWWARAARASRPQRCSCHASTTCRRG